MEMFKNLVQVLLDWSSSALAISAQSLANIIEDKTDALLNNHAIETMYEYVVAVGAIILVVYFLLDLYDKVSHESFSIDVFFYAFVKVIIFYMIMKHGLDFMKFMNGIAEWTTELILEKVNSVSMDMTINAAVRVTNADNANDFLSAIFTILQNLGTSSSIIEVFIYSIISNVVVYFIAYERVVSIGIQIVMGPFVLADISGHGFSVSAKHYLLEMFRLFMQEPVIIMSAVFVPYLSRSYDYAGLSGSLTFATIVYVCVLVKLLKSSRTITSDILT